MDVVREQRLQLEALLAKVDPVCQRATLPTILRFAYAVDVTFARVVVDWLASRWGRGEAEELVKNATRDLLEDYPLQFALTADGQPCVACYEADTSTLGLAVVRVPFKYDDDEEEKEEGGDVGEDESKEEEDGAASGGTVPASICAGDLVKLRCVSAVTWLVHAVLLEQEAVVLEVYRRDLDTKALLASLGRGSGSGGRSKSSGVGLRGAAVPEHKVVTALELTGATVWREGLGDSDRRAAFQLPTAPWTEVKRRMRALAENFAPPPPPAAPTADVGAGRRAPLPRRPGPRRSGGAKKATPKSTSGTTPAEEDTKKPGKAAHGGRKTPPAGFSAKPPPPPPPPTAAATATAAVSDPRVATLYQHCYQAQAEAFLDRDLERRAARCLLWAADPVPALARDRWLLVCRALRTVCRGGDALLEDFVRWTVTAGPEGARRARDARRAWVASRVLTTCDVTAVVQARVVARARLAALGYSSSSSSSSSSVGGEGRRWTSSLQLVEALGPAAAMGDGLDGDTEEDGGGDATLRDILALARGALACRGLYFLRDTAALDAPPPAMATANGDGRDGEAPPPAGALVVPAAVYEFDPHGVVAAGAREEVLVGTADTVASVVPGDVLLLPPFGEDAEGGDGAAPAWHRIEAVDLFYARLRVTPCPPPPACWVPHAPLAAVWLPVAALWAVPVCRLLPPGNHAAAPAGGGPVADQYVVYVTPIPSVAAAMQALQALPQLRNAPRPPAASARPLTTAIPTGAAARHLYL